MNNGKGVSIVRPPADALAAQGPARWAVSQLQEALASRQVPVRLHDRTEDAGPEDLCVLVAGRESAEAREVLGAAGVSIPDVPEAVGLVPGRAGGRSVLLACGSDVRGLVYAVTELTDRVVHAGEPLSELAISKPIVEQPANPVRSIARLFTSDVEDRAWFYDRAFWQRYLSMLATQRFNRFSLTLGLGYNFPRNVRDAYFYFPYPFLLPVPGYDVRATGLPDAERDRNLEALRFISDEATARGLHFQLALWTHACEWVDSPEANYTIQGLTPETHAPYCRDALRELLKACPGVAGVTFRIHGESGIPEGSYGFWKTVFEGIAQCGRRVEIDMHAKGMDWEMIDVALGTGMPVNLSPKYWAEHMGLPYHQASIREMELPRQAEGFMALSGGSRRFLRYGYGDLLREDRRFGVLYRIWPGTQRLLLWGDPAMAAGYGRYAHLCGCLGMEVCEPLTFKGRKGSGLPGGRDGYADASLRPSGGDYEKYLYTYRLMGRLLYNPDADPESWRRFLRKRYGAAAASVEEALANASRILPLMTTAHHPSASNNAYWPEVYTHMPIVDEAQRHPYGDTPSPKLFGQVSALDPELFSRIDDFAEELASGNRSARYSPLDVAAWLRGFAQAAADQIKKAEGQIGDRNDPEFRRVAVDVALQSGLGRFFAEKLRAGVFYAIHRRSGDVSALQEAVSSYRKARAAWAELVERAKPVYVGDLTFGLVAHLRGHWADRLPAMDEDIQDMEKLLKEAAAKGGGTSGEMGRTVAALEGQKLEAEVEHAPPVSFRRGTPVSIALTVRNRDAMAVRLRYRRVNQAEACVVADMAGGGGCFEATVPGDYTDSPYPLQYWFELRDASGEAWPWPGFNAELSNQPYFVVRQARS